MPMRLWLLASALPLAGLAFAKAIGGGKKAAALDKLWARRDENGVPEKVIEECEALLKEDPADFDANWRIARACWWLSNRVNDDKLKAALGERGTRHGKAAFEARPDAVEGHLWYACALGEYGLGISVLKAIARGLDGDFRKHAERAIEIDKACELGAPLRALGRFFAKLPWPKKDLKKSEDLLRSALEAAPKSLLSRLYLAETLLDAGKEIDAIRVLHEAIEKKPDPDETADAAWIRKVAQAHLDRVGGGAKGKKG